MLSLIRQLTIRTQTLAILACALLLCPPSQAGEIYVVVSAKTKVEQLNRTEVINIFMGRSHFIGQENHSAMPLDIRGDHPIKAKFYKQLIKRSLPEVQSYWARLMFSGDATPPTQISSYTGIRKALRDNQGAIAYLPASEYEPKLHDDLKIVHILKEH